MLRALLFAAGAATAAAVFSPLPYYCELGYPISTANLVADYDVNCNFNASDALPGVPATRVSNYIGKYNWPWWSRVNNGTTPPIVLPTLASATPRGNIPARSVYYLAVPVNVLLEIPVNISPSVMPNASVELLLSFVAGTSSNKFLWSAGSKTTYSGGAPNPRAFMIYDGAGAGAYMSVMGPASYSNASTSNPTTYTHIVITFAANATMGAQSATVYVNGVYADSRPGLSTVDGINYINYGGVFNTTGFGPTSSNLVYFRVWNRTLTQADAIALSTGSPAGATGVMATTPFLLYTRPLWSQPFAVCGVNPTVGSTYSSTPAPAITSYLPRWVVNRTALVQIGGRGAFVPSTMAAATVFLTGSTTSPTPSMTGNASYMSYAWTTLQPTATYATKFPSIPDNEGIWYGESKSTESPLRGFAGSSVSGSHARRVSSVRSPSPLLAAAPHIHRPATRRSRGPNPRVDGPQWTFDCRLAGARSGCFQQASLSRVRSDRLVDGRLHSASKLYRGPRHRPGDGLGRAHDFAGQHHDIDNQRRRSHTRHALRDGKPRPVDHVHEVLHHLHRRQQLH